jgi:hypothetical protein
MRMTRLSSGVLVTTYEAPPRSFDIDSATDEERGAFGFSRLPRAAGHLQARWESRAKRYRSVTPMFSPRAKRRTLLPKLKHDHAGQTTDIWSGVLVSPSVGNVMQWVEGRWSMPAVGPPAGAQQGTNYCASAWVGLDGDTSADGGASSGDVLQAGCDANVTLEGGTPQLQYRPWWEWYPADSSWIDNLAVSPGDMLDCLISLLVGSTTTAQVFLGNMTTNQGHVFSLQAPTGTSLVGNCAEWIIEAFGSLGPLASYGVVNFGNCNAGTVSGAIVPAGNGVIINMTNGDSGPVISTGLIVDATDVRVSYM